MLSGSGNGSGSPICFPSEVLVFLDGVGRGVGAQFTLSFNGVGFPLTVLGEVLR